MKLDPYTYGDSRAAVTLSKIIDELDLRDDYRYEQKVGKIWGDYSTGLKEISRSNISKNMITHILCIWRDYHLNRCNKSKLPEPIKTHLNNIIVTRFKQYLNKEIQ